AMAGARRGSPCSRGRSHLPPAGTGGQRHETQTSPKRKHVAGGCRVAPGTDEAQRQRELTKQALATSAGRLEQKVRAELDWKARPRRDRAGGAGDAGGRGGALRALA